MSTAKRTRIQRLSYACAIEPLEPRVLYSTTLTPKPAIVTDNNVTFPSDNWSIFTIDTTGVPAPALTESGKLPPGITFQDPGPGPAFLSGTPDDTAAGNYTLLIKATTPGGAVAT